MKINYNVSALVANNALKTTDNKLTESLESLEDPERYKDKQYDLLADTLRKSMNMELVYEILNKGME